MRHRLCFLLLLLGLGAGLEAQDQARLLARLAWPDQPSTPWVVLSWGKRLLLCSNPGPWVLQDPTKIDLAGKRGVPLYPAPGLSRADRSHLPPGGRPTWGELRRALRRGAPKMHPGQRLFLGTLGRDRWNRPVLNPASLESEGRSEGALALRGVEQAPEGALLLVLGRMVTEENTPDRSGLFLAAERWALVPEL